MSILKQTKFKFSKPLNIILAILILLSPIVSSANALLMEENTMPHHSASKSKVSDAEQMKVSMDHESCHKTSVQSNKSSVEKTNDNGMTKDCCDEPCLCAQAGCQSSTAAFHSSVLSVNADQSVFSFTSSLYLNPQSSPTSPPPIS